MRNKNPKMIMARRMLSNMEKKLGYSPFNGLAWRRRWFQRNKKELSKMGIAI